MVSPSLRTGCKRVVSDGAGRCALTGAAQGPHIYALYRYEKGFSEELITLLYAIEFVSGPASAALAGHLAIRFGRQSGCYDYCTLCSLSCAAMHSSRLPILLLGRVLGGMATTLLFSAFESWTVSEYHALELDDSVLPLKAVFENMAQVSSAVAIASGIAYDVLVGFAGSRVVVFLAAQVCCLIASRLMCYYWRKDGRRALDKTMSAGFGRGLLTMLSNGKVRALALATCCFEGSMYLFVFFWTAALESGRLEAGTAAELPLGLVFSSFICAVMIGSLVVTSEPRASSTHKATTDLLVAMLVASGSLSCAVLVSGSEARLFWAFCVLEASIGAYFPAMGFLKSQLVEDRFAERRVYCVIRLPLNLFVLAAHSLDSEGAHTETRCF